LAQSQNLEYLTHLIINDNAIGDEGILHISTSAVFKNLIYLDIK